jgi:hypothetical protein
MSKSDHIKDALCNWVKAASYSVLTNVVDDCAHDSTGKLVHIGYAYSSGEQASHWKRRSKRVLPDGSIERIFALQHGMKKIAPGMVLRVIPDHLHTIEHSDGSVVVSEIDDNAAMKTPGYRHSWE